MIDFIGYAIYIIMVVGMVLFMAVPVLAVVIGGPVLFIKWLIKGADK